MLTDEGSGDVGGDEMGTVNNNCAVAVVAAGAAAAGWDATADDAAAVLLLVLVLATAWSIQDDVENDDTIVAWER